MYRQEIKGKQLNDKEEKQAGTRDDKIYVGVFKVVLLRFNQLFMIIHTH